jgi:hypothetical protein
MVLGARFHRLEHHLHNRLGMAHSFLSKCETGDRRIDVLELIQLAQLYGKPPQYFLSLDKSASSRYPAWGVNSSRFPDRMRSARPRLRDVPYRHDALVLAAAAPAPNAAANRRKWRRVGSFAYTLNNGDFSVKTNATPR